MPAPSLLPILNAVGLSIAIVGITISLILVIVGGLLLFLVTAAIWIRDGAARDRRAPARARGH